MVYNVILVVHVVIAIALVGTILIQGGRGGLGETLGGSGASSLFGGGANVVMTKITAVGALVFMMTCLTLAAISTSRGRSVIERIPLELGDITAPIVPDAVERVVEETATEAAVVAEDAVEAATSAVETTVPEAFE